MKEVKQAQQHLCLNFMEQNIIKKDMSLWLLLQELMELHGGTSEDQLNFSSKIVLGLPRQ